MHQYQTVLILKSAYFVPTFKCGIQTNISFEVNEMSI